jgi:putative protein-disulfide isomerase
MKPKVLFVTDPMCSWCWGMSSEMARAMALLAREFDFDLVLGGINVDSTQPVNDFGRARLADVWRRVTDHRLTLVLITGRRLRLQRLRACAVEVVRELTGRAPFECLSVAGSIFLGAGNDKRGVDCGSRRRSRPETV